MKYDKKKVLERLFLTHKSEWFEEEDFGLDYSLLYSDPSPADVESEIRRSLENCFSVKEVISVSSAIFPQKKEGKNISSLAIAVHVIFDDEEEINYAVNIEI